MPRPRLDGTPGGAPNKRNLSDAFLRSVKPDPERVTVVWDTKLPGLVVTVQPSGRRAWKYVYTVRGRGARWYHIGDAQAIGLADARKLASRIMFDVASGKDPHADRIAKRGNGTFEELADRYLNEHAKKKNKSWKQADFLVRKYLLPKWAKLSSVTRRDVEVMHTSIEKPILANQVIAAASAIFNWAIKKQIITINPCKGVDRNETKSRERVLSDGEVPMFWQAFEQAGNAGVALKMLLLTGQRPGEIASMRREHIIDGWWEMPGEPVPELDWPGTKNARSHRVCLSEPVQALLPTFFGGRHARLDDAMRDICSKLKVERTTPHDLRRTALTAITRLKFGRDAMDRIANHKEDGVTDIYDRHGYAEEDQRIMKALARHILALAEGGDPGNVVELPRTAAR
jgi:integrase